MKAIQANGNGHDGDLEDAITYEPVYIEDELVGWWESEADQESRFTSDLPPELDDSEPPAN